MQTDNAKQSYRDAMYALAIALEAMPGYKGWSFSYEFPAFFVFSHEKTPITISATPDWECTDAINVQIGTNLGDSFNDGGDVPWPTSERTPESYMERMKPWLDKYTPPEGVKEPEICCAVCGSPHVSYTIWHHPNEEQTDGEMFGSWNAGDNTFCDECEENSDLVDDGAEPGLWHFARAKYRAAQNNTEEG